jgi:pilus assembly protein CpaF
MGHPNGSLDAVPAGTSGFAPAEVEVQSKRNAEWEQLRSWMIEKVLSGLPAPAEMTRNPQTTRLVKERITSALEGTGSRLPPAELERLESEVISEILGYGPLDQLLADPHVTEIMANGPNIVYAERNGRLQETPVRFADEAHMLRIIERIVRPLGRHVDRRSPMVDARLPDGSRVNIILPPNAIDGPSITIRKFSQHKLGVDDLLHFETLTPAVATFLQGCVVARLNIVIAGGTGSGKTTLLNVLSNFIPEGARIVTIEDAAELQLNRRHVVRLEARPAEGDGSGRVTIRDLVSNSLRMRPDRVIIGEVRGPEALDMLQAMNTGNDGSLATLHANTPRDVISRLETMTLMAGLDLPIRVVREQIAAAIDLIIQISRLRDGSRKVIQVTEVQGLEGDVVILQDVFRYVEHSVDSNGKVQGEMTPAGIRPKFMTRLQTAGIEMPPDIFGKPPPEPPRHR